MPIRRALPCFIALALLACTSAPKRAEPDQDEADEPAAEAERDPAPAASQASQASEPNPHASFGMPDPGPWSVADYSAAYKAVNAIAKQDPAELPRAGSATFESLSDLDHLAQLSAGIGPQQLAGLTLALGMLHMVYGDQAKRDPDFDRDAKILQAAVIRVTAELPRVVAGSEEQLEAIRGEPSRLQGLLKYRHGVHELVAGMLEPAPNAEHPPAYACEQLARVIDVAAPLLLADERTRLRERIRGCAAAGTDAEVIDELERALADDAPTAALVTGLLAEHREYRAAQAG